MAKRKTTSGKMSADQWKRMLAEADQNWLDYIERWPPAKSVRYDRATKRVVVQLVNGLRLEIPAAKLQGVASGNERQRADVHCIGDGTCLEWRTLDQHFSIEGLLTGRFGNKTWMASLEGLRARPKHAEKIPSTHHDRKTARPPRKSATAKS
ncbi:MAG TPA: DUF2442 domain-containing protein [Planctomycetaceae bacterium]|nr:DUF2442 domain-containing protein [Planctomycetaceae bacterium]